MSLTEPPTGSVRRGERVWGGGGVFEQRRKAATEWKAACSEDLFVLTAAVLHSDPHGLALHKGAKVAHNVIIVAGL